MPLPDAPGTQFGAGVKILNSNPVDFWYGPYVSLAEAEALVPVSVRANRTILVIGQGMYRWGPSNLSHLEPVISPNSNPSLRKAVRWYATDTDGYDGDGPTIADIDPRTMCLGTVITVESGPDGRNRDYMLVYDDATPPAFTVYRDATFVGPLIGAKLVLLGSEEQVTSGIPEWNPYGPTSGLYQGPDPGGHNGAQVTYQSRIWEAMVEMAAANYPGGTFPEPGTPGGLAFWKELSPTPVTHAQNTDTGTTSDIWTVGANSVSQDGTVQIRVVRYYVDPQRRQVAEGWRWNADGTIERVQCVDYQPPSTRASNVWTVATPIVALYVEDNKLYADDANGDTHLVVNLGTGGGAAYTLPAATSTVRGGVRAGDGVVMNGDLLSVQAFLDVNVPFLGSGAQEAAYTLFEDGQAGTYALLLNSGLSSVSYTKNGAPATLPVALANGDVLGVQASGTGKLVLRKQPAGL